MSCNRGPAHLRCEHSRQLPQILSQHPSSTKPCRLPYTSLRRPCWRKRRQQQHHSGWKDRRGVRSWTRLRLVWDFGRNEGREEGRRRMVGKEAKGHRLNRRPGRPRYLRLTWQRPAWHRPPMQRQRNHRKIRDRRVPPSSPFLLAQLDDCGPPIQSACLRRAQSFQLSRRQQRRLRPASPSPPRISATHRAASAPAPDGSLSSTQFPPSFRPCSHCEPSRQIPRLCRPYPSFSAGPASCPPQEPGRTWSW
mmetsp:Transcript_31661/g.92846  ORF Transcript_31661/g.92846 Transcript_31661/m.92846 type:complete len:250 (-) Transcript_31661:866-1615(-)